MKKAEVGRDTRSSQGVGLWGMAPVALLAHLASTELHESFHFVVGRLAGLPSHFLNLTSVGVDPSVAANASSAALALMNGVAPLTTMLLGIVALAAVPALRSKVPPAVTAFVAWWAIVGVPYIGLQTMTTAGPVRLRGNGSDFAAVLGGYFGVPILPRTAIAVAGLVIFMASGFCLGAAVSPRTVGALSRLTLAQRLGGLARWRVVVASGLSLLLIAMTVRGATLAAHGNGGGLLLLLEGAWVWAALMALLVRWRAPGAREVRDHWIFPGLLASAGLIAISLLTHLFDFFIGGAMFVVPLIATAWIQTRASAELPEWETN